MSLENLDLLILKRSYIETLGCTVEVKALNTESIAESPPDYQVSVLADINYFNFVQIRLKRMRLAPEKVLFHGRITPAEIQLDDDPNITEDNIAQVEAQRIVLHTGKIDKTRLQLLRNSANQERISA
jgi:hypothetical protein